MDVSTVSHNHVDCAIVSHATPAEFVSVSHNPVVVLPVVEAAVLPIVEPTVAPLVTVAPTVAPVLKNKSEKSLTSKPVTDSSAPNPEGVVTSVTENTTNLTQQANNTKKCGCKYHKKADNTLKVGYSQEAMSAAIVPLDTNSAEHMQIQAGVSQASRDVLQTGCHVGQGVAEASRNIMLNDCANTASIVADNQRVSFANQDRTDKVGISIRDAVEHNSSLNLTSTERNGSEIRYNLERAAGDTRLTVERTASETRGLVHENYAGIMMANKDNLLAAKDTQIDVKKAQYESREATLHLHRSLGKTEGRLALQAEKHHGLERLDLVHVEGRLQKQASDNYASVQLDALKNKEALARQMAECCCELKERVANTAAATQALIRDTETARLRDSLAAASQENLILRLRGALPTLPV